MRRLNIIITGPSLSGKTTFIKSLCEHVFISPEQAAAGKNSKKYRVEFGRIAVDKETFLYLAALTNEESFQFLWERLADGLLGFVVIFDAATRARTNETKDLIKRLKVLPDAPFVVVLNRLSPDRLDQVVELKKDLSVPREEQIICCDVANKESAKLVLVRLLNIGARQIKKYAESRESRVES